MRIGTCLLVALFLVCLTVGGCGGGDSPAGNGGGNGGTGTAVTGRTHAASGGSFIAVGGVTARIGNRSAVSDASLDGRFTITGVPAGSFEVTIDANAFGVALNPDVLKGTKTQGQSKDIGIVLLGPRPPDPGL